ncbi:MAG: hypothetical protein J6M16_03515 [Clostridia bacterium]|nr:hypothetical protein [Clostridia bacterium]
MILRKLQQFMYGRYGNDLLNAVLVICGMALVLIGQIFGFIILLPVSYVFYIFAIFRMLSKNIPARQKELFAFLKLIAPVKSRLKIQKDIWQHRNTHKYFRCPECKQWLRAPKGRGKIQVKCQKCGNDFIKKV